MLFRSMVFMPVVILVATAASVFITIQLATPILYDIWFNNLRNMVAAGNLRDAGDNAFNVSWVIMSYVVPGLLILWAIVLANRKRAVEGLQ